MEALRIEVGVTLRLSPEAEAFLSRLFGGKGEIAERVERVEIPENHEKLGNLEKPGTPENPEAHEKPEVPEAPAEVPVAPSLTMTGAPSAPQPATDPGSNYRRVGAAVDACYRRLIGDHYLDAAVNRQDSERREALKGVLEAGARELAGERQGMTPVQAVCLNDSQTDAYIHFVECVRETPDGFQYLG